MSLLRAVICAMGYHRYRRRLLHRFDNRLVTRTVCIHCGHRPDCR